jgi:N-acetylglutamate synthase-like GNAT family acetyltransferase
LKKLEGIVITMDCSHIQFCVHEVSIQDNRQHEIDYDQLQNLFRIAAFWAKDRSIDDLKIAIANSAPVVTIWDERRLIGFARATSDGIYRATIWDVVVHPDYQGLGLGRKLVETVLTHPKVNRVERVYLMTTNQQHFYERIGFECNSTTTMVLQNQPIVTPLPTPILQLQA